MKKTLSLITIAVLAVVMTGCVAQSVPRLSLTIDPVKHTVDLSNPKDTTVKNFRAEVQTNGASVVSFDSLTTVMNPDVITTTGDAQAKLVEAGGNVAAKVLSNLPKP